MQIYLTIWVLLNLPEIDYKIGCNFFSFPHIHGLWNVTLNLLSWRGSLHFPSFDSVLGFVTCSGQHSGSDAIFWCVLPFIPLEQNHCVGNKQKLVCRVMRDKLPGSPHWPSWWLSNQQASERGHSRPVNSQLTCHRGWHMPPAAAAIKSPQSCPTLCDPRDGSPPGSPVPRILQARTLAWLPFPSPMHACVLSHLSRVWLCATPETAAHQAPLSTGFSRQEHWSGLLFPSPNT